jgi:hypothetical protein
VTDDLTRTTVVLWCGGTEVASWPLGQRDRVDLDAVEELARLQLAARRLGFTVGLRHAGVELRQLLELAGLTAVVPVVGRGCASVEVFGKPEGGEEPGVEEVVVPDDPVA